MAVFRAWGGVVLTSVPSIRIRPAVGISKPAIIRRAVVLPQPDGPSSVTSSPSRTSKETPSTAVTRPPARCGSSKVLVTFSRMTLIVSPSAYPNVA